MIYQFPMTLYVRYVDLFNENGSVYMRRFPVTSVTRPEDFIKALRVLGILTNEERWELKRWDRNDYQEIDGIIWWERELLWITDNKGEYAPYMVFPGDLDAIEEIEDDEDLRNVVRVDFRRKLRQA